MKKLPLLALGLLLLSMSSPAQTKVVDRTEWREFNFLEGGIKVTFPGEPSRSTAERQQPAGKVTSTELHLSFPQITFMLSWSDFPRAAAADDHVLHAGYDTVRDQVLTGMSAKLIGENDIRADGFLGRELVFKTATQFVKYRVYFVGRREYQLITSRYADLENDPDISNEVDKFLDSFHFISQTADNKQKKPQ